MRRPRILVTLDTGEELRRGVPFPAVHMKAAYATAVERAGGTPVLVAPTTDPAVIADLAALMDGLVVTGGAFDLDPALYGRSPAVGVRVDQAKPGRTAFEWALLERALARDVPVLGVCGGMQLLDVVLGGTLILDLGTEHPGALEHEQPTSPAEAWHDVELVPGTALHAALGVDRTGANSTHHQAVAALGRGLTVLGRSPDGVIEAIGRATDLAVLGVQWHPELLADHASAVIYGGLIDAARARLR